MRRFRARASGFTLAELLIAMTVAFVLVGGGYFMLNMATDVYRKVSGHEDGALQMKKAARQMQVDLLAGNISADAMQVTPKAGPVGNTGDAVWMLSTASGVEADGATCANESGEPYWQRNVIYYPARPTGDTCAGLVGAGGYEVACPHKTILRKVVDTGNPSIPLSDTNTVVEQEELLAVGALSSYLTRPAGLLTAPMLSEPNLGMVEIVSVNLLTMRIETDPDPNAPGEIKVTYQAFNELSGSRTTNVGSTDLTNHAKTLTHMISVFPRNNR